jgi:anti-sigma-K factor RskA
MSLKERMARAEDYVLGRMDEHERERAERDMEVDTEFCECVLLLADRLHKFDHAEARDGFWGSIAAHIGDMPQIPQVAPPPGRRETLGHSLWAAARLRGGLVVLAGMTVAFALGYLAGRFGAAPF